MGASPRARRPPRGAAPPPPSPAAPPPLSAPRPPSALAPPAFRESVRTSRRRLSFGVSFGSTTDPRSRADWRRGSGGASALRFSPRAAGWIGLARPFAGAGGGFAGTPSCATASLRSSSSSSARLRAMFASRSSSLWWGARFSRRRGGRGRGTDYAVGMVCAGWRRARWRL